MALINFIRDYERVARFRFGKFEGMMGPGIVFAIPIIHQIQKIDTRATVLDIPRQTTITRDNASIEVDFLVYYRVDINASEKAIIEVEDFRAAVVGLATTTLRAVIGDIDLDDVLSQRERINEQIRLKLDDETKRWGIKVTNVEIREVDPPVDIKNAMNRQMAAERFRRATVTEAEGEREAAILRAEGQKRSEILKSEGDRQAAILRAEGYSLALSKIFEVAQGLDRNTMTLEYINALKQLSSGDSSKLVFLPIEFSKVFEQIGDVISTNLPSGKKDNPK